MPVPPSIDPRLLAAEIEATVAEFNRLAALAVGRRHAGDPGWDRAAKHLVLSITQGHQQLRIR